MLRAISQKKDRRIEHNGAVMNWRELFHRSEDLLSATFFERIPYLSDTALSAVLHILIGPEAHSLSPFQQLDMWPQLSELDGRLYVEPDVILRFENELVMVEVKPPFGGVQTREQWLAQMTALAVEAEYSRNKRIFYVALGQVQRLPLIRQELPHSRFVGMTVLEWSRLRRELLASSAFNSCRQDKAVLDDWMIAFKLFGMATVVPSWSPLLAFASNLSLDTQQLVTIKPLTAKVGK